MSVKLSEIPDDIKNLILGGAYEVEDVWALTTEELWFVRYYAPGAAGVIARMTLMGRPGVGRNEVDGPNPWDDMLIELDEPLPALRKPKSALTDPQFADCWGENEIAVRLNTEPDDIDGETLTREEYCRMVLTARYEDVFRREIHHGWELPGFDAWAKKQKVPIKK